MASFMRKLAPQLVTPDRQLSYFSPDMYLSRVYILSRRTVRPDCLPHRTRAPTYLFQRAARGQAFDLPTY